MNKEQVYRVIGSQGNYAALWAESKEHAKRRFLEWYPKETTINVCEVLN